MRRINRSLWLSLLMGLLACNSVGRVSTAAADGAVTPAASMNVARSGHTSTLLPNGDVLITGGMNGNVLIAGGYNGDYLTSAEIYDPATGKFTPTGPLSMPRSEHTAALLDDGRVLLVGGVGRGVSFLTSAEIYDPATGKFTVTGSLNFARESHTATLLKNGKVLITGGHKDYREAMTVYASAELYDPAKGMFTATGNLTMPRHKHAAVLLPDGNVLVVGGSDKRDWNGKYDSAEIYDSVAGRFKAIGHMQQARFKLPNAVVLLNDGKVLIAGGADHVEIYDPATQAFHAVSGRIDTARFFSSATLLRDGRVLITGGYNDHGVSSEKVWTYRANA